MQQQWHEIWDERIGKEAVDLSIARLAFRQRLTLGMFASFPLAPLFAFLTPTDMRVFFVLMGLIWLVAFPLGLLKYQQMGVTAATAASKHRGEPVSWKEMPILPDEPYLPFQPSPRAFDKKHPPRHGSSA